MEFDAAFEDEVKLLLLNLLFVSSKARFCDWVIGARLLVQEVISAAQYPSFHPQMKQNLGFC